MLEVPYLLVCRSMSDINHMMIFLEQFVAASDNRLSLMQLEKYFPYSILRTNYINLYQKADAGAAFSSVDDDVETTGTQDIPAS